MSNRKFVNPASISKYLKCQLCTEVFVKPTRIPCGHIYCLECINKWIEKSPTCPICRRLTLFSELQRDLLANNLIGELQVYCDNKKNLCKWQGALDQYQAHEKRCQAVDIQLLLKNAKYQVENDEEIEAVYNKYDPGDLMARLSQKLGNNQEFQQFMPKENEFRDQSEDLFEFLEQVEAEKKEYADDNPSQVVDEGEDIRRTDTVVLDSLPKQKRDRNDPINNINQ